MLYMFAFCKSGSGTQFSISCALFLIFLIGMFYKILFTNKSTILKKFNDLLSNEQKIIYQEIIDKRRNIYLQGYGLGFLLALAYIYLVNRSFKMNKTASICLIGSIMFVTNYFYYILHPKGKFMLDYLTDPQQIKEWVVVYKQMQWDYHFGMLLGLLAVMMFGNAFCM